jgi:hypothetical protein
VNGFEQNRALWGFLLVIANFLVVGKSMVLKGLRGKWRGAREIWGKECSKFLIIAFLASLCLLFFHL